MTEETYTSDKSFRDATPVDAPIVDKPMSTIIKERLRLADLPYFANDTLYEVIRSDKERALLQDEVALKCQAVLESLIIDTENDHNTKETGKRMAKMFINEVMKGRYHPPPKLTAFPNAKKLNEIYTIGPIKIRSMCSHHFVPIIGEVFIGVVPGNEVIGLSKFNRLCDWVMSRPQIQEEAIVQITDLLEEELKPQGIAVVMKAEHMCMCWRGVKDDSTMTNSVVRGLFAMNPSAKQEFFSIIAGQGFGK